VELETGLFGVVVERGGEAHERAGGEVQECAGPFGSGGAEGCAVFGDAFGHGGGVEGLDAGDVPEGGGGDHEGVYADIEDGSDGVEGGGVGVPDFGAAPVHFAVDDFDGAEGSVADGADGGLLGFAEGDGGCRGEDEVSGLGQGDEGPGVGGVQG